MRSRLQAIVSPIQRVSLDDWVFSSTWIDLPSDCRPKLAAEALSWLNGASQAPDVFRAIVFALGDLNVGPQVGLHTSVVLRAQLRAEIRSMWRHADFLTLSRYVLADRITPGDAVLAYYDVEDRFDPSKELVLRCEDGLAARVKLWSPFISLDEVATHFPCRLTQPRMVEFLLPYIRRTSEYLPRVLIFIAHCYRAHLREGTSFSLNNLESHLYEALVNSETREEYATEVNVKYGGAGGAIELLTFLCCNHVHDYVTKTAAIGLLIELLDNLPRREHRCLAYLFGSNHLCDVAWPESPWSWSSLSNLSRCLENSRRHPFQPTSARTQSDDREFDFALAFTSVMLLSPGHDVFGTEEKSVAFLFGYLCQPSSPSIPDSDGKLRVIRLILETGALLRIVGMPEYLNYDDNDIQYGLGVLTAIITDLGRRLREGATDREWEQLFQALAYTDVKGENGASRTWDLGVWLRTQSFKILKDYYASATSMQSVHDALVEIYPLCDANHELRAQWDRIGYPGRPGDIFSDPFLDVGAFFENGEDPAR